jgi:hypothetical protein
MMGWDLKNKNEILQVKPNTKPRNPHTKYKARLEKAPIIIK